MYVNQQSDMKSMDRKDNYPIAVGMRVSLFFAPNG